MTALLARRLPLNIAPIEPINLIWLAFTLSVTASMLPMLTGGVVVPFSFIFAVVGSAGCGWLWLFARSLFRKEKPIERWNIYAVAAIVVIEGTSNLVGAYPANGSKAEMYRILGNAESFICIGALAMVFAEVFSGYGSGLSKQEQRFRRLFVLVLGVMIALSLLWVLNANANSLGGQLKEPVLITTALLGVLGTRLCISFRKLNPLQSSKRTKFTTKVADDDVLANRIIQTLEQDKNFATPELKVADLAELLGEHEYKVTQCITGSLGYRNFNHLINSHRIDSAKEALACPGSKRRPILSVAFDCGFNSIGPFNRAFKRQVGMTPREYRAAVE
jgi:AraC-like DNA-binding protein